MKKTAWQKLTEAQKDELSDLAQAAFHGARKLREAFDDFAPDGSAPQYESVEEAESLLRQIKEFLTNLE